MQNFLNNLRAHGLNKGMTYAELIVVLGIFSVMSAVVIFNYGKFQDKIDIKNLANEIAIKIVQAQKDATSGQFPSLALQAGLSSSWKPAYGIIFDMAVPTQFIYLVDLDNSNSCTAGTCVSPYSVGEEVLEVLNITKSNTISGMSVVVPSGQTECPNLTKASFYFTRPNANPIINTSNDCASISYVQLNISSPAGSTSNIKIYPSGRIQIN